MRPFEYYVRGYFRTAPQLDASIKIYAYDDYTSGSLQRFDLDIEDWATILEKIGEMKPKYIFLDRVWSFPVGKNFNRPLTDSEAERFKNRISKISTKIIVGSFTSPEPIANRTPMGLFRSEYSLTTRLVDNSIGLKSLRWLPIQSGTLYGPHKAIAGAFTHIGHLNSENFGYIRPPQNHPQASTRIEQLPQWPVEPNQGLLPNNIAQGRRSVFLWQWFGLSHKNSRFKKNGFLYQIILLEKTTQ